LKTNNKCKPFVHASGWAAPPKFNEGRLRTHVA
jgi:hypothetical protein